MKFVLAFLLVFGSFTLMVVASLIGVFNYGNRAEKQIVAQYENMANVLSNYGLKVSEVAQIPDMYRDDVTKVVKESIQGRYGNDGAGAIIKVIREDNQGAKLEPVLYTKIQQIIEAGRNEYQNTQTGFIDVKRGYETTLGSAGTGTLLRFMGYPKINLADYKIVKSEIAIEALKTGVDKGLTIRK